ncbi:MAG: adenylyl-sulfate kinase [Candidatus Thermoplasmatota archaeon]|jgi:adenylylsulfate kinase|nr:adenylyl-sulfate kinase [Candidatus Thermoplasmatota archaeon]
MENNASINAKGTVIWFTGIPASGKTTLGKALETVLKLNKYNVELLDGDEIRRSLSPDLGYSKEERERHAYRVIYIAKLLERNNVFVIVTLISPYKATRQFARNSLSNFVEVYVKAPLEVCISRDPKGLYKKALNGEIHGFTGIDDPYEVPDNPDIVVETDKRTVEQCTGDILRHLKKVQLIKNPV